MSKKSNNKKTKLAKQEQAIGVIASNDDAYKAYLERLSDKKKNRILRTVQNMRHGLNTVAPLICPGPNKCPFIQHCPIPTYEQRKSGDYGPLEDYPYMLPCVLERNYQTQKIIDYIQYLDVNPENPIEMAIVNELAIIDLYISRAVRVMSTGDRMGNGIDLMAYTTEYVETGDETVENIKIQLHPVFDAIERLQKRRDKLIGQLGETREFKAQLELKRNPTNNDPSLLEELKAVRSFLEQNADNAIAEIEAEDIPLDE